MTWRDRLAFWVLKLVTRRGSIRLVTPDGLSEQVGAGTPEAEIRIHDRGVYRDILRGGVNGFGDAYIDGRVSTPDLLALMRWGATNHRRWTSGLSAAIVRPLRAAWKRLVPARPPARVDTMVDHYDLGNTFYEAWLDESMTYSSARFGNHPDSLAAGQRRKYQSIAAHARLKPGMRVLEIGCGWGGFAAFAASEIDADLVGVTVSAEQAEYARKRLVDLGVADRVDIRLADFRTVEGAFDAVVSIEMIESVDETVWPALFEAFHDRLMPGGYAVVQAITIDDDRFDGYRDREDFIRRHVFPGGQLPSPKVMRRLARDSGLEVVKVETFGHDYALTLQAWARRFEAAWPDLEGGFDERFRRLWDLYLAYCQAGFESGVIDVGQWVLRRP